jgi:hypothetical protein
MLLLLLDRIQTVVLGRSGLRRRMHANARASDSARLRLREECSGNNDDEQDEFEQEFRLLEGDELPEDEPLVRALNSGRKRSRDDIEAHMVRTTCSMSHEPEAGSSTQPRLGARRGEVLTLSFWHANQQWLVVVLQPLLLRRREARVDAGDRHRECGHERVRG